MIRAYIKNQELADQQLDQLEMKLSAFLEPVHNLFMPGFRRRLSYGGQGKSRFFKFFLLTYVKYAARSNLKKYDFRRDLKRL